MRIGTQGLIATTVNWTVQPAIGRLQKKDSATAYLLFAAVPYFRSLGAEPAQVQGKSADVLPCLWGSKFPDTQ